MVRAVLDGSKTQTRRVCKPAEAAGLSFVVEVPDPLERGQVYNGSHFGNEEGGVQFACPYGGVGDRLWAREAFRLTDTFDADSPNRVAERCLDAGYPKPWAPLQFEADGDQCNWMSVGTPTYPTTSPQAGKLRPGIHMPRWASRIDLEVTGVRVERLKDISEEDCYAEGIDTEGAAYNEGENYVNAGSPVPAARWAYNTLWEEINGKGPYHWEANPWVWVIEFRRIKP